MRCCCNQILKILWEIKVPFGDICFGRLNALVHFCTPDVEDITVNICKKKQLTNMRASGSDEALRLIRATQQSFFEGIRYAQEGYRLSDISAAIQAYAESQGYSIVREYVGHGIGRNMHEAPEVPNYGRPGHGPRLLRGMTIAVEPMVNAGSAAIVQMPDGWTVRTADGKYAAHYENTVLITAGDPELLTDPEGSLV